MAAVNKYNLYDRVENGEKLAAAALAEIKELRRRFDILVPARDGADGARGETGETGAAGRDGKKGADSTVAGPPGAKGDTGAVLVVSDSEVAAAVIELRAKLAQVRAAFIVELDAVAKLGNTPHKALLLARLNKLKVDAGV